MATPTAKDSRRLGQGSQEPAASSAVSLETAPGNRAAAGEDSAGSLTKRETQAFARRWQAVNGAEPDELASPSAADKFRQRAALLALTCPSK
jgi:hypothetical protein